MRNNFWWSRALSCDCRSSLVFCCYERDNFWGTFSRIELDSLCNWFGEDSLLLLITCSKAFRLNWRDENRLFWFWISNCEVFFFWFNWYLRLYLVWFMREWQRSICLHGCLLNSSTNPLLYLHLETGMLFSSLMDCDVYLSLTGEFRFWVFVFCSYFSFMSDFSVSMQVTTYWSPSSRAFF